MPSPIKPAINTVTLRSSSPSEIVSILQDHGLAAVEWAGDVHVPPGDLETAKMVRTLCREGGITITSYGAYHQCDTQGQGNGPFQHDLGAEAALETTEALGAPAVRVWAGRKASATATPAYREEVANGLQQVCDKAQERGLTVHLEFHRNTLTDDVDSALALIQAVDRPNLFSYWQPRHGVSDADSLEDIAKLGDHLSHLHIFQWRLKEDGFAVDRRPLAEGKARWIRFLSAVPPKENRYAMMEFVRGDTMEQFSADVAVFKAILAEA